MSYTPTEWKNGDVITAEKLNKLEEGVQEALSEDCGVLVVTFTPDQNTLNVWVPNKTYAEILAAHNADKAIIFKTNDKYNLKGINAIARYVDGDGASDYFMATQMKMSNTFSSTFRVYEEIFRVYSDDTFGYQIDTYEVQGTKQ